MLTVSHLSKQYRGNPSYSLQDVSFSIQPGEIVGLIGKNGAGKTTLMKMLAKAQRPTSGSVTYNGVDIFSQENMLSRFGIMIQPVFVPNISAQDNLRWYLAIHGETARERNIRPTLELVDMWRYRDRKPSDFSFGMKQRLALALALVSEPEFLILDEPFVGLDPDGVLQLMSILQQWVAERSVSLLISSHQLNELQALCSRFLFLKQGRLASAFTADHVGTIIITLARPLTHTEQSQLKSLTSLAQAMPATISLDGVSIQVAADHPHLNAALSMLVTTAGVASIHDKSAQLNDYFGDNE
ncbi:ABC transporter ATP-binding protein [Bifidobacterium sp. LC6]|uniref:ABC transporter ATP-binding protein n=1 Tax=Bifidobacterium colobi TaxID=2809026 RepID=A0ABS5UWV4_9BIFI|nr:ABC transporter ATP-binding protein [Bifidobacterium colobi]MBT1175584.1 ABC transporter ATP-binding protein [Bifidobacterium colobi]